MEWIVPKGKYVHSEFFCTCWRSMVYSLATCFPPGMDQQNFSFPERQTLQEEFSSWISSHKSILLSPCHLHIFKINSSSLKVTVTSEVYKGCIFLSPSLRVKQHHRHHSLYISQRWRPWAAWLQKELLLWLVLLLRSLLFHHRGNCGGCRRAHLHREASAVTCQIPLGAPEEVYLRSPSTLQV